MRQWLLRTICVATLVSGGLCLAKVLPFNTDPKSVLYKDLLGLEELDTMGEELPLAPRDAPRAEEIEFVSFEFQEPTPMHVSVSLSDIEGEPSSGTRYPVHAEIGGEEAIASASFEVITEDGALIQPLLIAPRGSGVPGHFEFIGLMNVPSHPFRIVLTGTSVDGRPFRRVYERLFRPVTRPRERRPIPGLPPEYADHFQRQVDAEGPRLIAEAEAYVAAHATVPLVMPRTEVSRVMHAPLSSAAGHPIGVRITYDVEFSQAGQYNPVVRVHPEYLDDIMLGGSAKMNVLNSSLEPLPRQAHAPHAPAGTGHPDNVLAYGAHFLYEPRTVYHFTVDLVPSFITPSGLRRKPCVSARRFHTAKEQARVAKRLASEAQTTYRVYIGGKAFEGRIDNFYGEGTFYRGFVKEAVPECPQPVM